ncbi:hypothetical protein JYK21_07500 [Ralstonia pickettii]|nr:hypothetical protein [Ralstonia pickettii]
MNLRKYFNENVKIIYKDGEEITGYVEVYTPAIDTDEGLHDEIVVKDSPQYPGLNEVGAEEIDSIEII